MTNEGGDDKQMLEGQSNARRTSKCAQDKQKDAIPVLAHSLYDVCEVSRMLLDLGKAVSFFAGLLSLYWTTASAFFMTGTRWQDRLLAAGVRLVIAGCVCFASGLIFSWPSKGNPDAGMALVATLPVQLFLWFAVGGAVLFAVWWLLSCGGPCYVGVNRNCLCT
jgi:hypothetical protein